MARIFRTSRISSNPNSSTFWNWKLLDHSILVDLNISETKFICSHHFLCRFPNTRFIHYQK